MAAFDALVTHLRDQLKRESRATMLALWPDGEVTREPFGVLPSRVVDGIRLSPLIIFSSRGGLTRRLIEERLLAAFRRHGLTPLGDREQAGPASR